MNIRVDDNNEVLLGVQTDEIDLRAGDTINLGSSDYNDLTNKPSIEGVELVGDVSLDDLGVAYAEDIPTDVSELNNDAGYITASDIPPIPSKTSDLLNDSGFITEDDIPPLVTDLGTIDPEPYDDDISLYLNTLTENGFYYFTFGGDDFSYIVQVEAIDYDGTLLINQHYWGDEEGPISEYVRAVAIEEGEVVEELTTNYITMDSAVDAFASKSHVHYRTATAALSVWDYCNGNQISFTTDSPIIYTDTRQPRHAWLIETTTTVSSPNMRFIRLTDLHDASVFYQRSGAYSNGVITWGDWEYIGSLKITVNGTNYPITAITKTILSGVSGVLVDYDDGDGGQLFFADGVGLNTVKTVIESAIPHDTSDLTNGAGFLTISDLPIYDGGVQ